MQKNETTNNKLNQVLALLNKNYVDNINSDSIYTIYQELQKTKSDSLEKLLIDQLLATLDPHSLYIPPVLLKQVNEEMKGEFAGIGVEYNLLKDTITVTQVITGGPAAKAGILVGDKITRIGDTNVANIHISNVMIKKLLRGKIGSKVVLTIKRGQQNLNREVVRGIIVIPSIESAYMIMEQVGYIKLNKFSLTSFQEFNDALVRLKSEGMQRLIFDLRGNGGGVLGDAAQIADAFLDGDKMIVYTEGAHQKKQIYTCKEKGNFETGKLVLLIDEESASASEIVAGALQDWDRATLIGRRTYGKGLVQRQFGFSDQSGVRITVARYYTPSGRSIQKTYAFGKDIYEKDLENRMLHNGLINADSNKMESNKSYKTQSGRVVYGGGGISPDLFIGMDTSVKYFTEISALYEKNTMQNFCFGYFMENKDALSKNYTSKSFAAQYIVPENVWIAFEQICRKDSIDLSKISGKQKNYLKERIKQLIAKLIWQLNGYYEVINLKDEAIQKALQILKK